MIKPTEIPDHERFLNAALTAMSSKELRDLMGNLPIVGENDYLFDEKDPMRGWRPGFFHWYPVGGDRGNAGRIKLAGSPENPIAERTINAMEAIIELEQQREIRRQPSATLPQSPREAVFRYLDLPPLDQLPKLTHPIKGQKPRDYAGKLARRIRVRLSRSTRPVEYAVVIEDEGIGQPPGRMHETLLSLGRSDKTDKPYLIGVFGQGGSSAYAACDFSWLMSRRSSDLINPESDGIGWTVVKRIIPVGRRDVFWAYLAAHPDGRVARLSPIAAEAAGFKNGTRIAHLNYNFGRSEPARTLYQSLNHLIFNPILPYELITGPGRTPDPMLGNSYRLTRLGEDKKALDKIFSPQLVEKKIEATL